MTNCTQLETIEVQELPESVDGCEDCLREGGVWLHLRICLGCGHVGCCDNSPGRHATAHNRASGHPLIRSLEPGEDWSWCYEDAHRLSVRYAWRGAAQAVPSAYCRYLSTVLASRT
jgi:hypothetical protein